MQRHPFILLALILVSCSTPQEKILYGSIERIDPSLNEIVSADATIEIIADSLEWSEGPLWLEAEKKLIFSDVPKNTIYEWSEEGGKKNYLTPSGYTGNGSREGEPGSNGLALDTAGNLLLCQHGDRRVAVMQASLQKPEANFKSLTEVFDSKKLNSPNDLTVHSSGAIFFTDPPYGLLHQGEYIDKQLPFQGVYLIRNGATKLLIDSLTFPNGIALSPDEKKLYVAVSDPARAKWYEYDLSDSLTIMNGQVFYDATASVATSKGLPDGLKVDSRGNIFASGPGGIWIFNSSGTLIGKINLPEAASNCALTPDGKTLFVTNDMYILRIKMRK